MTNPTSFTLTPEVVALVKGAFEGGNIILLAAVDQNHKPVLSFRGSTAVFSESQLSFWARNAEGGTVEAIKGNPQVVLMYRSPTTPFLQFIGRARVIDDPAETIRAYEIAPEKERASDPERKGLGVLIDLDEVKGVLGRSKDGPIFCHLSRS